jgi:hypothetical protein
MKKRDGLMPETSKHRQVLLTYALLTCIGCLLGCALGGPTTVEVWSQGPLAAAKPKAKETKRSARLQAMDAGRRPVSHDPPQEFYIRWPNQSVQLVRFEYRQVRLADKVVTIEQDPKHKQSILLTIPAAEIETGGAVCAWRVTLWADPGTCVAQKKSATWQ